MTQHLSEEDLICLYYGEPGAPLDAQEHLAGCPDCQSAANALRSTLTLCNDWDGPERSAEFGRDVWLRLLPELEIQPERRGWRTWFASPPVRAFVGAGALAVLLATAFVAGRMSRPAVKPGSGFSDTARQRILASAVADHLDRVQILLTEISNGNDATLKSFADERARAQDLLQEGRLMRQTLAARGDTSTTGFLDQIEMFLTEAEHTPDGATSGDVLGLRDRMEQESLLFKVRIVESNLRNEEKKL